MKAPVPITLLVDDSCPLVHVYRNTWMDVHGKPPVAGDGREMEKGIPNSFLDRFCDVVTSRGIAGKISVVPCPGGLGDIVKGIPGYGKGEIEAWIRTALSRLPPRFDFSPEGLTHTLAVDLATGKLLSEDEYSWSKHQGRDSLRDYLVRQLELLKSAGIDASGVTSPWFFGKEVEDEYRAAIIEAQRTVYGRDFSWYFVDMTDDPLVRPKVIRGEKGETLVSIPTNIDDFLWATIWEFGKPDGAIIGGLADKYLTADGRRGRIREILDAGGWPIFVIHWQCLFSNGHETGLMVLDELGKRIRLNLDGLAAFKSCMELSKMVAEGGGGKAGEAR